MSQAELALATDKARRTSDGCDAGVAWSESDWVSSGFPVVNVKVDFPPPPPLPDLMLPEGMLEVLPRNVAWFDISWFETSKTPIRLTVLKRCPAVFAAQKVGRSSWQVTFRATQGRLSHPLAGVPCARVCECELHAYARLLPCRATPSDGKGNIRESARSNTFRKSCDEYSEVRKRSTYRASCQLKVEEEVPICG